MDQDQSFISLESACTSIKHQDIQLLKAIAKQLKNASASVSTLPPDIARYANNDTASRILRRDIASYLEKATGPHVPVLFETLECAVKSSAVLINREWLSRQVTRVSQDIGLITTVTGSTANEVTNLQQVNSANTQRSQPPALTEDELKSLRDMLLHQNSQSKAQKNTVTFENEKRIDAERRALQAEALANAYKTQIEDSAQQILNIQAEKNEISRQLNTTQRELQLLQEETEGYATLAVMLDPEHPLSPPEMRRAFTCWNDLTTGGQYDLVAERGIGVHALVDEWLKKQKIELKDSEKGRLKACLSWRKGHIGMVRKNNR